MRALFLVLTATNLLHSSVAEAQQAIARSTKTFAR
jgi:hypothetical protein